MTEKIAQVKEQMRKALGLKVNTKVGTGYFMITTPRNYKKFTAQDEINIRKAAEEIGLTTVTGNKPYSEHNRPFSGDYYFSFRNPR